MIRRPRPLRPRRSRSGIARSAPAPDAAEVTNSFAAVTSGVSTTVIALYIGQVWVPGAGPDAVALGRRCGWSRRVDDDYGWYAVRHFGAHLEGLRWVSAQPDPRRARVVITLVQYAVPAAHWLLLGGARGITQILTGLDRRLRTDTELPARPALGGSAHRRWIEGQVEQVTRGLDHPATHQPPGPPGLSGAQFRRVRDHLDVVLREHGVPAGHVLTLAVALEPTPLGWLTSPPPGPGAATPTRFPARRDAS